MRHCDDDRWAISSENAVRVAQKLNALGLGSIKAGTSIFDRAKKTAELVVPILGLAEEVEENIELAPQGECLSDGQRAKLIKLTQEVVEDTLIWFTHEPIIKFFPREFCEEVLGISCGTLGIGFAEAIVIDCEDKTCKIIGWSIFH
jgi:phosphohistidine phosphatase SixA